MSEFRVDQITNRDGSAGTQICGVSTFSGTSGMVMPGGPTVYRGGRGRAVRAGGRASPTNYNTMDYVEIATLGNAVDFGDSTVAKGASSAFSSPTRVCNAGGYSPSLTNLIEYVQIMTTGNGTDFGDMTHAPQNTSGCSNGHGGL